MPPLVQLDPGGIFGAYYGRRPPKIVALHGWGRTHKDFDRVLSGLPALSVDLPGFGVSSQPESGWGSIDYADRLADVLSDIGERFVIVGHSFGGRVAIRLAERHPSIVCSLVLTGAPLVRSSRKPRIAWGYRALRALAKVGAVSDARLEAARQKYGSSDYRSTTGVMREVLVRVVNEDYSDILGRIGCDVRLVWGANDGVVPVEVAQKAQALLPRATLRVCQGEDHYSVLEHPELKEAIEQAEAEIEFSRPAS